MGVKEFLHRFKGVQVPLVIPIDENGKLATDLEYGCLEALVNHVINGGVGGILANGTTGEFYDLDCTQRKLNLAWIVEYAKGRVPVIANVTDNIRGGSYEEALARTKRNIDNAAEVRADAVLVCPYFYNAVEGHKVWEFTKQVADYAKEKGLPLVLYNIPSQHHRVKGVDIYNHPLTVIERLSKHENIIGIKDSSGDIDYFMWLLKLQTDRFKVLQGCERNICATFRGNTKPAGIVPSLANVVPAKVVEFYKDPIDEAQREIDEACRILYGPNYEHIIQGIKYALSRMGIIPPRMAGGKPLGIGGLDMGRFEVITSVR